MHCRNFRREVENFRCTVSNTWRTYSKRILNAPKTANTVEKLGGDLLHDVSQELSQLSRLLIHLRRHNYIETPLVTLKDFMKPQYFDQIIISVKNVCSFEESGKPQTAGVPSLALKLGYSLKKCSVTLTGQALREKDNTLLTDQQNLENVMDSESMTNDKPAFSVRSYMQKCLAIWNVNTVMNQR